MGKEKNQPVNKSETVSQGVNFMIVRHWDKTVESLRQQTGLEALVLQMGFDLPTLTATLNREFPQELKFEAVNNSVGEKIEDVGTETITVNDRLLDRLQVIAYPSAANVTPTEMTKFKSGGEVILVTQGEAEITHAQMLDDGSIYRGNLISEKVEKGDLIVSTDTPNNWTKVVGDKFTFIYFVDNPNGPQKYGDIPKDKISVK